MYIIMTENILYTNNHDYFDKQKQCLAIYFKKSVVKIWESIHLNFDETISRILLKELCFL